MTTRKKQDKKQLMTRAICFALAAVMVLTTLVAAVLSQIW